MTRGLHSRWAEVSIPSVGVDGFGVVMPAGEARAIAGLLTAAGLGPRLADLLVRAADKAEARAAAAGEIETR